VPDEAPETTDEAAADSGAAAAAATANLPDDPILKPIVESLDGVEDLVSAGQDVVMVEKDRLAEVAGAFKDGGFELLTDVTATDYLGKRRVRFEVVVNLVSVAHASRVRLRAPVPADDTVVPSLVPLYPGANFFEREVYDMFGIEFDGHPDMTRILMPDDWVGFPLRKDFSTGAVPVQFKDANKVT